MDVNELAQIIRKVDGDHSLGAGELAERILEHTDMGKNASWNKDRIVIATAQIHHVQNDMMMVLDRGHVNQNVKERMVKFLRNAADDLEMMV